MHKRGRLALSPLFLIALIASIYVGQARAGILLNTGPGPDSPIGFDVYGLDSPYGNGGYSQSLGGEFTIAGNWTINSVSGWMAAQGPAFNFPPGPVELNASIYSNVPANPAIYSGTGQPGSAIFTASFQLNLCTSAFQQSCPVGWQGPTGLSWKLGPGTYWVVFEGIGTDTGWAGMPTPVSAPLQNSVFLEAGGNWGELAGPFGVQVSGTSAATVAEPATFWLMLAALALLACWRRAGLPYH